MKKAISDKSIFYFPGWVRKSITFTIDDGNVPLDLKFMGYTKPAGITGTFNITTPLWQEYSAEDYRRIYEGYEIANHCRYHAYPFTPELGREMKDELFDPLTADPALVYRTEEPGLFRIRTYDWCYQATDDKYMECADSCQKEIEAVFGDAAVKDFIWPCGAQNDPEVFERLKQYGFRSIRATGCVEDSTGFAFPADRMAWSYNANYLDLTEVAAKYDAFPDDGALKFFCFGVHSHDFENAGRWDVLEDFCEKYGNRPETFWYTQVGTLFDYEDAVKGVYAEENRLVNPSTVDLYLILNGEKRVLPAHGSIEE